MGDVLRTTPIIRKLRHEFPGCEITWITKFPELAAADIIVPFTSSGILSVTADRYDIAYNFDKGAEACALLTTVQAHTKKGFVLRDGRCHPIDKDAEQKFLTGIFDQVSEANMKSYVEETFDIAGLPFGGEKYIIKSPEPFHLDLPRPIVGLNTGCGTLWRSRLWPASHWKELAFLLQKAGYSVLLLGGEQEHALNTSLAKETSAHYPGHIPLGQFPSLVNECDLVISSVTLGFHIALALGKKVIVLNSIFNKNEFELYGLGRVVEPPVKGKYFTQDPREGRMDELLPTTVFEHAHFLLRGSG